MKARSKVVKTTKSVEQEIKELKALVSDMQFEMQMMQEDLDQKQDKMIRITIKRENVMNILHDFSEYPGISN